VQKPIPEHGVRPRPLLTSRDYWALALLTVGALALRLVGLNKGLWFDEILTLVRYVRLPLEELLFSNHGRNNHILYSALANLSVSFFGESAWSLRLPAALFGAATVPAAYYLGLQLSSRREAFLAAMFLLGSYHHIWFSQNARGYSGVLLTAVLLSIILIRMLQGPKPPWTVVAAYATTAILGMWLHFTTAMIVLAHGMVWLGISISAMRAGGMRAVNWRAPVAFFLTFGAFILSYTFVESSLSGNHGRMVLENSGMSSSILTRGASTGKYLLDEALQAMAQATPASRVLVPLMALALMCIVGAGLISYLRQGWLSWSILVLPAFVLVIAFLALKQMLFPRFMLCCFVFLLLIGVRGGYALANRLMPSIKMNYVSAIGLTIVLGLGLMLPRAWQDKQSYEAAFDYLRTHVEAGDALLCDFEIGYVFDHYLNQECSHAKSMAELRSVEAAHARTWYVYTLYAHRGQKRILPTVQSEYVVKKIIGSTVNRGDIVITMKEGVSSSGRDSAVQDRSVQVHHPGAGFHTHLP